MWIAEACNLADANGDPWLRYWTHSSAMIEAMEAGDVAAYRAHLAMERDIASRIPHASIRWNLAYLEPNESLLRGDLEEADQRIERGREIGEETGQRDTLEIYAGQLVNLRHHQGRYGELLELLETVAADSPRQPVYRAVLAVGHALEGDAQRAQELLDQAADERFDVPADVAWASAMACWTEAAVCVGDRSSAIALHEVLAPCRNALVIASVTVLPPTWHYVGRLDHLLGNLDEAERRFATALEFAERLESPLLAAYTEVAWAELLVDRGEGDDIVRARALAEGALAAATAGGYGYIERDARAVLTQLR